jgi:CoA-substrate-specific enzyme activase, putative
MLTAGVDIGLEYIKIVVLKDGEIAAKGIDYSGGAHRAENMKKLWNKVLSSAGYEDADIVRTVSTGQGKIDADFSCKSVVEPVAAARAARYSFPSAVAIMDIGAFQTRLVVLGEENRIEKVVLNQKCMSGLGLLIEIAADRLEMSLEEISALESKGEAVLNDGCAVFAEQGMLEMLNDNVPCEIVADAVLRAVSVRLHSILNDKEKPQTEATILIGGVAKNKALVRILSERTGIDFLVPAWSEYGCAVGAALIAADLAS